MHCLFDLMMMMMINFETEFPFADRVDLELTMKTKLTLNLWNSSSLSFPRAEITAVEASHLAFGHSVDQNVHSERLASIKFPRLQMKKLR